MARVQAAAGAQPPPSYSLWQLVRYAARLGSLGFGGPVALVGYMHRDLVERRRWIAESDYREGLALAQLAPGPLAAQLAIYLGYVDYGVFGATLVGLAFVLPSFLMVVAVGWAYVRYGGLDWMQAVFYTIGASVIGIIAHSAYRLTTRTIGRDRLLWGIYLFTAAVTVITESEQIAWFLSAGVLAWLLKASPSARRGTAGVAGALALPWADAASAAAVGAAAGTAAAGAAAATSWTTLWQLFLFFSKAGAFVFGSGLAIVPFLFGGVVKEHQWLNGQQFLDAVAVAMVTPGPVVITVGFIGYLVAGLTGATVAALATFLPCYLFTIIPAPYFKKYGKLPGIAAFVEGVTAAATGAIAGAVVVLGRRSIHDLPTALLALGTLALLWRSKRASEPLIVASAAAIGLAIDYLGRR